MVEIVPERGVLGRRDQRSVAVGRSPDRATTIGQRTGLGRRLRHADHAKADGAATVRGLVEAAVGGATVPSLDEEGAAAHHAGSAGDRPLRILFVAGTVVTLRIPVLAPFPDIAMHV